VSIEVFYLLAKQKRQLKSTSSGWKGVITTSHCLRREQPSEICENSTYCHSQTQLHRSVSSSLRLLSDLPHGTAATTNLVFVVSSAINKLNKINEAY
jgi:hypothetical protein